jgi:hypothetical protein
MQDFFKASDNPVPEKLEHGNNVGGRLKHKSSNNTLLSTDCCWASCECLIDNKVFLVRMVGRFIFFVVVVVVMVLSIQMKLMVDETRGLPKMDDMDDMVSHGLLHFTDKSMADFTSSPKGVQRARFRQSFLSNSGNTNNVTVATFVKNCMLRDVHWYMLCMKYDANLPVRAVPRSCPPDGKIDRDDVIYSNPLQDHQCSVTESVDLVMTMSQISDRISLNTSPHWTIRTLDNNGNYKTMGGDEFYVTYTDGYNDNATPQAGPTAVAIVKDLENGSYRLEFVTVPPLSFSNTSHSIPEYLDGSVGDTGLGRLEIFLQYTCYMGTVYQPLKDGWKTGGASNIRVVMENIIRPRMQTWQDRLKARGGVIRNPKTLPDPKATNPSIVSLSQFDTSIFFGDSLMAQMVMTYSRPIFLFHSSKVVTRGNADITLSMGSLDSIYAKLDDWWGETLLQPNTALVLGSASWDMSLPSEWQGPTFEKHLLGCRELIRYIRANFPQITIIWRLPTAIHVHHAKETCFTLTREYQGGQDPTRTGNSGRKTPRNKCADILRYASTSRIEYLYEQQLQIMLHELHVPVIDLYELSYLSAHHLRDGDALHFSIDWNLNNLKELIYPDEKDMIQLRPVLPLVKN